MLLIDASAWIEFLRGAGSPADRTVTRLIGEGSDVCTSEAIVMELLAGAANDTEYARLQSRLRSFPLLPLDGPSDYEEAARVFRSCRAQGETIRRLTDCLIAVVATRAGVPVLHANRDFEAIARHTDLEVFPLDP